MGLRAVIFDYGMVLTGLPDQKAHGEMLRITGLEHDAFEKLYWADRHAYDEGKVTGLEFWRNIVRDAGLALGGTEIAELNAWDAGMWTTENPAMLAWQQKVRERGLKTAILSNMGDSVLENLKREFDWLPRFDVLVWSYQLKMAKPDPAIYRHVLEKLGTKAEESLFLDDKRENIEAARKLGMRAIQFTNVTALRDELKATGLDKELPLPE